MKIIKLSEIGDGRQPKVDILPDSSLQKSGKPFFVPDFASDFRYKAFIAVHICRLGKNIAKKFANRYYNEIGLCLAFEAADLLPKLQEDCCPWALATAFDSSVIVGDFYPVDSLCLDKLEVSVKEGGSVRDEFSVYEFGGIIDSAVEFASSYFTFKIGDFLLLDSGGTSIKAVLNEHVSAELSGRESVNIRIK